MAMRVISMAMTDKKKPIHKEQDTDNALGKQVAAQISQMSADANARMDAACRESAQGNSDTLIGALTTYSSSGGISSVIVSDGDAEKKKTAKKPIK
jgi:hypothetical protein